MSSVSDSPVPWRLMTVRCIFASVHSSWQATAMFIAVSSLTIGYSGNRTTRETWRISSFTVPCVVLLRDFFPDDRIWRRQNNRENWGISSFTVPCMVLSAVSSLAMTIPSRQSNEEYHGVYMRSCGWSHKKLVRFYTCFHSKAIENSGSTYRKHRCVDLMSPAQLLKCLHCICSRLSTIKARKTDTHRT